MDRTELIKALGQAFTEPEKKDEETRDRVQIESAIAGEKSVLRLRNIREISPRMELQRTHPEAYIIDNLVTELTSCGDRTAERAGRDLQTKYETLLNNSDQETFDETVETYIKVAKELTDKLHSTSKSSPQRSIVYMLASDRIKTL